MLYRAILLFVFLSIVRAQLNPPGGLSACALSCVAQTVPAAGCSLDDSACQCSSKPLSLLLSGCMVANCTMQESLGTLILPSSTKDYQLTTQVLSRNQAVSCDLPFRDKSNLMVILFTFIIIFTSILVALRMASKIFIKKQVSPEDYFACLAQCMSIVSNTFAIQMSRHGFGKHLYSQKDGAMKVIFFEFYIGENIYVAVLGLIKISILAFYLRIFQLQTPFRIAVYATIIFVAIGTSAISFLTIFQCQPVASFWDTDLNGKCLDINALAYANSGLSIVQDFLIIILPIRVVWQLNLDRKKKWSVAFMFALGGFGCIVSIVRLQSLLVFGASIDPSWDYVAVVIWTVLELAVAIICSCLPALRTLAIHMYPRFASSFRSSSSSPSSFSSINSRTKLRPDSSLRRGSVTGAYLMGDVHIECGRLDIKWDTPQVHNVEEFGDGSPVSRRGSWL
ncbi:hypothetical protein VTL71DRAFT_2017 [Oculimacula yallundae]|uniref:Extracellular membrane protein CFEM domain-containing protein n=1 Tax=Oculimacula yallundae TaxID=86028 RepID=A0ABR4CDJ5_9HELO